jgi:hypothetical protein
MSEEQKSQPEVRSDEAELNDEALEQVAGGCQWGDSRTGGGDDFLTIVPTLPTMPIMTISPTDA